MDNWEMFRFYTEGKKEPLKVFQLRGERQDFTCVLRSVCQVENGFSEGQQQTRAEVTGETDGGLDKDAVQ